MEEKNIILKMKEELNVTVASLFTTYKEQSEQIKKSVETYQRVDGSGCMAEPSTLWAYIGEASHI